jgi:hypothetical protein
VKSLKNLLTPKLFPNNNNKLYRTINHLFVHLGRYVDKSKHRKFMVLAPNGFQKKFKKFNRLVKIAGYL